MDINFHYFAVKTIAVKAGFSEQDAQYIARYSQFVDDFDLIADFRVSDVPSFAQHLAYKSFGSWVFRPVTTALNGAYNALYMQEYYQKRVLIPFHFVPKTNLREHVSDRTNWRVVKAKMSEPSLVQKMMKDTCQKYETNKDTVSLMRLGMMLHIFADTYSHQRFSGFWNWENYVYIKDAVDNNNQKNITSEFDGRWLPSIGHGEVYTAPDCTYLKFSMYQCKDAHDWYSDIYTRNNTEDFMDTAEEIYSILRSLTNAQKIDWEAFKPLLAKGFLTTETSDVKKLCAHWKNIFPDISYSYNKDELFKMSFESTETKEPATALKMEELREKWLSTNKSDDFFHYNVIANEISLEVNGGKFDHSEMDEKQLEHEKRELNSTQQSGEK